MAHPCVRISVLMGLKVLLDNQHAQVGRSGSWQGSWQGTVLHHSTDCSTCSEWCCTLDHIACFHSGLAPGPVKQYL
jgi:hypothetical protein